MTASQISYQLGGRCKCPEQTSPILWNDTKSIKGVLAFAKDEKTQEYVQVYESGPTQWVDGEPQAWSSGNFETVEAAKYWASQAYKWLNKA